MKTTAIILLSAILSFSIAQNTSLNDLTVKQQMENLNACWKNKTISEPLLEEKIPLLDDVSLIMMHLSLVEKTLRDKDASKLSAVQKNNRHKCLKILHEYRANGIFPINTRHSARTPYFVDDFGTACAVGQLIIETGFADVAAKIQRENNYAYISELNSLYPELQAWAGAFGFEMDELAWIQPGYVFNCGFNLSANVQHTNVSCYGGSDGSASLPDPATWGGVPPFYIDDCSVITWLDCIGLSAGDYQFCVYDSTGAMQTYYTTITQPDSISISLSSTDDNGSCIGSAIANASGGTPPFTYLWNTGDTTPIISNACSGMYSVTLADANGCMKSASIMVASLPTSTSSLTHGPIVGAVSPTTARVFVRTSEASSVTLHFSTDNFTTIEKSVTEQTLASRDSSNLIAVSGLAPSTRYRVRAVIDGQPSGEIASFKTFPPDGEPGHYKFLFGSCQYELMDSDSSIFVQMKTEDADVFTPTGDWGYPDRTTGTSDLYFSTPAKSWATDYDKVLAIYKERYASTNSAFFLRSIALDYTHDDHDYTNDNTAGNFSNIFDISTARFGEPKTVALPPAARDNCLKGYRELFPCYSLPDSSEGIFHSYVTGNCEIFVLDTRSARSPQHDAIVESGGKWTLQEPPGHSILGQSQMTWLLDGLKNSTADWKIIVSSVTFNAGYKAVIDSLLAIGKDASTILGFDLGGNYISTGLIGAGQLSDLWVGFPTDQTKLLDHIETHQVKNIFIVSGDAHSAALDDGANSGIPELMSANLKKANSQDPLVLSNFIGYPLWNKGASGMGNQNFNNTYGKVEVFGKDSLRMSAVDASGAEVAGFTFLYQEPVDTNTAVSDVIDAAEKFKVYPNPSSSVIYVESIDAAGQNIFLLMNSEGKKSLQENFNARAVIDVSNLPAGIYLYHILDNDGNLLKEGKIGVAK